MTLLEDLATYLDANSSLTIGTDLFAGQIPSDAPDAVTCLYEYPGTPPTDVMGASAPIAVQMPRVQVVGRGSGQTDYPDARARVRLVYNLLHAIVEGTLSGTRYLRVSALQEPFAIGRDDNQRVLIACNFEVWRDPE